MRNVRTLIGAAAIATAGCTVNPKASMVEVSSPGDVLAQQKDVVGTFYLQSSRLDMTFAQEAKASGRAAGGGDVEGAAEEPKGPPRAKGGGSKGNGAAAAPPTAPSPPAKPGKWALTVVNEPTEARDHRFILLQHGDLISRTSLLVAKRPNTDLIQSIGSEVTDNRIALLQNVASVAKVAIGLVGVAGEDIEPLEATFSLADRDPASPGDRGVFVKDEPAVAGEEAGWERWKHADRENFKVAVGPAPVTASPYNASLLTPRLGGVYHSACRPVVIRYSVAGQNFVWRGKIADPDAVEFTGLPRKGKIEFHSQCGVSVQSEKDPTSTPDALIAAAAAQAAAVYEAYDKAKDE